MAAAKIVLDFIPHLVEGTHDYESIESLKQRAKIFLERLFIRKLEAEVLLVPAPEFDKAEWVDASGRSDQPYHTRWSGSHRWELPYVYRVWFLEHKRMHWVTFGAQTTSLGMTIQRDVHVGSKTQDCLIVSKVARTGASGQSKRIYKNDILFSFNTMGLANLGAVEFAENIYKRRVKTDPIVLGFICQDPGGCDRSGHTGPEASDTGGGHEWQDVSEMVNEESGGGSLYYESPHVEHRRVAAAARARGAGDSSLGLASPSSAPAPATALGGGPTRIRTSSIRQRPKGVAALNVADHTSDKSNTAAHPAAPATVLFSMDDEVRAAPAPAPGLDPEFEAFFSSPTARGPPASGQAAPAPAAAAAPSALQVAQPPAAPHAVRTPKAARTAGGRPMPAHALRPLVAPTASVGATSLSIADLDPLNSAAGAPVRGQAPPTSKNWNPFE